LSAVTSFSAARRLNAYSTATSTDIGSVSAITEGGSPFPTSSPNCREMKFRIIREVSAASANVNGPTCSLRMYLLRIFTKRSEVRPARGTSRLAQGCSVRRRQ
jgi:hypothetical protein